MEIMVSLMLVFSPESVAENVDLSAKGALYLMYMWAARQFALGVIFAFATIKKSVPILTICYLFLLVMMVGDLFIGISQKENAMSVAALAVGSISVLMLYLINKKSSNRIL